jgi:uncharacterized protein
MLKYLAAAAFLTVTATGTNAASFDCEKAGTADEKAICDNRALNDADVKMSTMFDLAVTMVAMGERDSLRAQQAKWLETRSACKADVACLKTAYDLRITDLGKSFVAFEKIPAK